jgi:hypothetical protein
VENNRETDLIYRKMMKKKTGEERVLMGFSMFDFTRSIVLSSISKYASPKKQRQELFLRFYRDDFKKEERDRILKRLTG